MMCPCCNGKRTVWYGYRHVTAIECDYCHGVGAIHCCEGDYQGEQKPTDMIGETMPIDRLT